MGYWMTGIWSLLNIVCIVAMIGLVVLFVWLAVRAVRALETIARNTPIQKSKFGIAKGYL